MGHNIKKSLSSIWWKYEKIALFCNRKYKLYGAFLFILKKAVEKK
jgi:hypothetical protein